MKILVICAALVSLFAVPCSADDIIGVADSVDEANRMIRVSGIAVSAINAKITDQMDQPVRLPEVGGKPVKVIGYFTGPGAMAAMRVSVSYAGTAEIRGRVQRVDAASRELSIGGVRVKVPPQAWIEGYYDTIITLDQVALSYDVLCTGVWTDILEFTARKVEMV